MTNEQRKHLAISAAMEGNHTSVKNIGDKIKISEMELICLTNFAEVGLMYMFSQLEGDTGADALKELEQHMYAICHACADGKADGLTRLSQSTAAILRSERIGKYLVPKI